MPQSVFKLASEDEGARLKHLVEETLKSQSMPGKIEIRLVRQIKGRYSPLTGVSSWKKSPNDGKREMEETKAHIDRAVQ
jgi:hypothetical protein